MNSYSWNPVYNLVMKMKQDYKQLVGEVDTYDFKTWLQKLNRKEYDEVFACLHVNQKGSLVLFRYDLFEMKREMWEDQGSIYRECRSVVVDLEHEEVVLSPYQKFFNLNEVEENKVDAIQQKMRRAKVVEIADKLDGSMQNARWYRGNVFMAGSMAVSMQDSWRLEDGHRMLSNSYVRMLKEHDHYTFVFEYISQRDAHVVNYTKKDEGLYLIGVRNTYTGEHLSYCDVLQLASAYGVKAVSLENKTLENLLEDMKTYRSYEKEGWVLHIDGHFIKVKCDDYVSMHGLLDRISSVNVIIQAIAEETYDDMVSKVPDAYRARVEETASEVFKRLKETKSHIKHYYEAAPKDDRKKCMIWIDQHVPKALKSFVRNEFLGKRYDLLKKVDGSYRKLYQIGIDDSRELSSVTKEGEPLE